MKTTKLYQEDVYIKEWRACITSITEHSKNNVQLCLTLDKTAFFPEGEGQRTQKQGQGPLLT